MILVSSPSELRRNAESVGTAGMEIFEYHAPGMLERRWYWQPEVASSMVFHNQRRNGVMEFVAQFYDARRDMRGDVSKMECIQVQALSAPKS